MHVPGGASERSRAADIETPPPSRRGGARQKGSYRMVRERGARPLTSGSAAAKRVTQKRRKNHSKEEEEHSPHLGE